ncbi:MAG: response regulator [Chloroflexi bacterium]|nr:MAG: response regulator [Chloroflexota bacterium]
MSRKCKDQYENRYSRRLSRIMSHFATVPEDGRNFLPLVTAPASMDLIIVDFLLMAELSGAEVIRYVRTVSPDMPAILISAAPLTTLQAATIGLPRLKILQKPFETRTLLTIIQTISRA